MKRLQKKAVSSLEICIDLRFCHLIHLLLSDVTEMPQNLGPLVHMVACEAPTSKRYREIHLLNVTEEQVKLASFKEIFRETLSYWRKLFDGVMIGEGFSSAPMLQVSTQTNVIRTRSCSYSSMNIKELHELHFRQVHALQAKLVCHLSHACLVDMHPSR
jgi:hypothetical protein